MLLWKVSPIQKFLTSGLQPVPKVSSRPQPPVRNLLDNVLQREYLFGSGEAEKTTLRPIRHSREPIERTGPGA